MCSRSPPTVFSQGGIAQSLDAAGAASAKPPHLKPSPHEVQGPNFSTPALDFTQLTPQPGAARGAVTGAIGRLLVKTGGRMPGARKIEEAVAKVLEDQKSPRNTAALCAEVARKYDSKAMVRVSRDTVAEFDPRKPGGDTEDTSKYTVTVTDLTGRMLLSTDGPTAAVVLNSVNSTTPTKPIALTK